MILWDHKIFRRFWSAGGQLVSSVSKHHNAFIFRAKQAMKNGHAPTKNQKANEGQRLVGSTSQCPYVQFAIPAHETFCWAMTQQFCKCNQFWYKILGFITQDDLWPKILIIMYNSPGILMQLSHCSCISGLCLMCWLTQKIFPSLMRVVFQLTEILTSGVAANKWLSNTIMLSVKKTKTHAFLYLFYDALLLKCCRPFLICLIFQGFITVSRGVSRNSPYRDISLPV